MTRFAAVGAAGLAALLSPLAWAAELASTEVWRQEGHILVSFDIRAAFAEPAFRKRVQSGLRNHAAVHIAVADPGGEVYAGRLIRFTVVRDPWSQDYAVSRQDAGGPVRRLNLRGGAALDAALGSFTALPVARADELPENPPLAVRVRVELNPAVAEDLERVREHLRTGGGHGDFGRSGSLLGAFVGTMLDPPKPRPGATEFLSTPFRVRELQSRAGAGLAAPEIPASPAARLTP